MRSSDRLLSVRCRVGGRELLSEFVECVECTGCVECAGYVECTGYM